MSEEIILKLKRGVSGGSIPTGLTHGELAVNTTDRVLFVGSVTGGAVPLYNRTFIDTTQDPEGTWYPNRGDRWWTGGTGSTEKIWDGSSWVTTDPGLSGITITGATLTGGATVYGGITAYGGVKIASGDVFIYSDITKGTTGVTLSSEQVSTDGKSHGLRIDTPYGYVTIGPLSNNYSHFVTDRSRYYFSKPIQAYYAIGGYDASQPFSIWTPTSSNGTTANRITVLTGPDSRLGGFVGIGTVTPQEKLDVNGDTIIRGALDVTGGMMITGGCEFVQTVRIANGASITGGVSVLTNPTILFGPTRIGNGISVTGGARITGNCRFFGVVDIANGLSVTGGATITGNTTLSGEVKLANGLSITGDSTITGNSNLFGTTRMGRGLFVNGGATFGGGSRFFGNMTINGNLAVSGTVPSSGPSTIFTPVYSFHEFLDPVSDQSVTVNMSSLTIGRWYYYLLSTRRTFPPPTNTYHKVALVIQALPSHVFLIPQLPSGYLPDPGLSGSGISSFSGYAVTYLNQSGSLANMPTSSNAFEMPVSNPSVTLRQTSAGSGTYEIGGVYCPPSIQVSSLYSARILRLA